MPEIIQPVNCNLQWRQRQIVYAKQGDYGARKIRAFLYDGSSAFDMSDAGLSALFVYKKADGTSGAYGTINGAPAITLDTTAHTATVQLHQQVLTCPGIVECELQLLTSNSQTATFTFQICVEASVASDAESEDYYDLPYIRTPADMGGGVTVCYTGANVASKVAVIPGYTLTDGGRFSIRFVFAVPAGATLAVSNGNSGTGTKPIWYRDAAIAAGVIQAGDLVTFVYDATTDPTDYPNGRYVVASIDCGTSWARIKPADGISIYDMKNDVQQSIHKADTAIQPQTDMTALGGGIAQSSTQGGTVPKTATLTGYKLTVNALVAVKFTTPVEASATLDINSTGAKPIFYKGSAITAGIIGYGDTVLFCYDGTNYHFVTSDRVYFAASATVGGAAKKSAGLPSVTVDSSSTSTAFVATVPEITELADGVSFFLNNNKVNSAAGCTLNVNGLGAKPIYSSLAAASAVSTTFKKGYTMLFQYDSTRVSGGCWVMYYGYDANTTYTNAALGSGHALCDTAAATAAKTATLSSYVLVAGGDVTVKFTYGVPAGATLNINSKGAKDIYYNGAAITAGVIKAGDVALFRFDGTYYHLITIDRWGSDLAALEAAAITTSNLLSNAQAIASALFDAEGVGLPLVIDGTGEDGDDVYLSSNFLGVVSAFKSAGMTRFSFAVPIAQNPTSLTDFRILAVAQVGEVDWTNYTFEFVGIGGGNLYSVTLSPVSGQNAMSGTLSVTDLTLPLIDEEDF